VCGWTSSSGGIASICQWFYGEMRKGRAALPPALSGRSPGSRANQCSNENAHSEPRSEAEWREKDPQTALRCTPCLTTNEKVRALISPAGSRVCPNFVGLGRGPFRLAVNGRAQTKMSAEAPLSALAARVPEQLPGEEGASSALHNLIQAVYGLAHWAPTILGHPLGQRGLDNCDDFGII